ncbi:MAG: hypothetical protein U0Q12_22125 [Vicinamibacterales bacterium]
MSGRRLVVVAIGVSLAVRVGAQERETPERMGVLRRAIDSWRSPLVGPTSPPWVDPKPWLAGFVTLLPPDTPGEFIKVVVPVGALVSHAIHRVGDANRRRAERAVRDDVLRELREFQKRQPERR